MCAPLHHSTGIGSLCNFHEESDNAHDGNIENGNLALPLLLEDEDGYHDEGEAATGTPRRPSISQSPRAPIFRVLGFVVGFVTQVISLSAYKNLLVDWPEAKRPRPIQVFVSGDVPEGNETSSIHTIEDLLYYFGLQMASKIDLILYVSIWIVVTMTLSRRACLFCRRFAGSSTSKSIIDGGNSIVAQLPNSRRMGNIFGINLFVGIVVGNLAAWFLVDSWLGFPVPLCPILGIALFDAVLCWFLIWSFDNFLDSPGEHDN